MMTPPPQVRQRNVSPPARRTAGVEPSAGRNAANLGTPLDVVRPTGSGPTSRPCTRPHIKQRRSACTQSLRPTMVIVGADLQQLIRTPPARGSRNQLPAGRRHLERVPPRSGP